MVIVVPLGNKDSIKSEKTANYYSDSVIEREYMMRKIRVLLIACLLFIVACGPSTNTSANSAGSNFSLDDEAAKEVLGSDAKLYGAWIFKESVDEFGDVQEDSPVILATVSSGEFSNTATTGSDLSVGIFDWIPDISQMVSTHVIQMRLFEYKNVLATYLDSSKMSMKVKVDDKISEFKITGTAPNGDIYLGLYDNGGDYVHDSLYYGKDVRCIIYIDNSQYNFTIPSSGFADICAAAQEKQDIINEAARIKTGGMAFNAFLNEDNTFEAYTYLKDSYESFPKLSTEEIKKEIKGDFFQISMSHSKPSVPIIISYWNIMNFSGSTKTQTYYFKEGKDTEQPEKTDFSTPYDVSNDQIMEDYNYQIRKVADGYYVAYVDKGDSFSTPKYLLIKNKDNSGALSPEYPLPN